MSVLENGLWRAADVLNDRGFVKKRLSDSDGKVCALGAYNVAHGRKADKDGNSDTIMWATVEHSDEMAAVAETIKILFPARYNAAGAASVLMEFNDNSETTQEDLAKVFRVAAVKLATGV